MMIAKWYGLAVLLGVLSLPSAAQSAGPVLVKLTVKHNGKEVPTPDRVTLNFDSHVLQILLQNGRFKVPAEVFALKEVSFSAVVDGNRIRTVIPGTKFTQDMWTLLMADRHYDQDYASAVPKGAKVRSSCIMVFESLTTDPGTVQFDPHCRTKNHVHSKQGDTGSSSAPGGLNGSDKQGGFHEESGTYGLNAQGKEIPVPSQPGAYAPPGAPTVSTSFIPKDQNLANAVTERRRLPAASVTTSACSR
jgi:hypothetical protein